MITVNESLIITRICKNCEGTYYSEGETNKHGFCPLCLISCRNKKIVNMKESQKTNKRYISSEVKQIVWNRDGGRCVCCNSTTELEFDHIIPVSKGGSNFENNIQLLCRNCNRTKSAKIV